MSNLGNDIGKEDTFQKNPDLKLPLRPINETSTNNTHTFTLLHYIPVRSFPRGKVNMDDQSRPRVPFGTALLPRNAKEAATYISNVVRAQPAKGDAEGCCCRDTHVSCVKGG